MTTNQPQTTPNSSDIRADNEKFCHSCGKAIKQEAVICVHCGVSQSGAGLSAPKDKSVAIILAVFLGFWTWLYTYDRDAAKFWVGLALTILLFWTFVVPFGLWLWAVIDVAVKDKAYYDSFASH